MQAYKLKGKIDRYGHLIITEPINLNPGDVEVIILQQVKATESSTVPKTDSQTEVPKKKFKSRIKAFQGLFENAPTLPPDFDPEQAK